MGWEPCAFYQKNKLSMSNIQLLRIVSFSIIPVTILSVLISPGPFTDIITSFNNTTALWIIKSLILYVFWLAKKYFPDKSDTDEMMVIHLLLIWYVLSMTRGVFIASTYWDWKGLLNNSMALLIPIVAYASSNKMVLQSILSTYIKYMLPLFLIFAFLISIGAYGVYLVPISFLLLFFPILTSRWKVVLLALALSILLGALDARSNVIKFAVPMLLSLIFYLRNSIPNKLIEWVRKFLFMLPFILLFLATTGVFNVFQMQDYIEGDYVTSVKNREGGIDQQNLLTDTRTFLYREVLLTAQVYNSWWIGRSPARGSISSAFGEEDLSGRGERLGNEVAILNIFTWTGIIGVILNLMVYYKASYLAINQSNNIFSKILGLFIAFRWTYAWVEDINYFTITTFFLWMIIGICFSKSFRSMSNNEVAVWLRGIFDKRYLVFNIK